MVGSKVPWDNLKAESLRAVCREFGAPTFRRKRDEMISFLESVEAHGLDAALEADSALRAQNEAASNSLKRKSDDKTATQAHDYGTRHREKRARRSDPGPGLNTRRVKRDGGPISRVASTAARAPRRKPKSTAKSAEPKTVFDGVVVRKIVRRASYSGKGKDKEQNEGGVNLELDADADADGDADVDADGDADADADMDVDMDVEGDESEDVGGDKDEAREETTAAMEETSAVVEEATTELEEAIAGLKEVTAELEAETVRVEMEAAGDANDGADEDKIEQEVSMNGDSNKENESLFGDGGYEEEGEEERDAQPREGREGGSPVNGAAQVSEVLTEITFENVKETQPAAYAVETPSEESEVNLDVGAQNGNGLTVDAETEIEMELGSDINIEIVPPSSRELDPNGEGVQYFVEPGPVVVEPQVQSALVVTEAGDETEPVLEAPIIEDTTLLVATAL